MARGQNSQFSKKQISNFLSNYYYHQNTNIQTQTCIIITKQSITNLNQLNPKTRSNMLQPLSSPHNQPTYPQHSLLASLLPSSSPSPHSNHKTYLNYAKKQHRNGIFVGSFTERASNTAAKDGLGLLMLDTTQMLLGQWQHDQLFGDLVYLGSDLRIFGKVGNRGMLEGFNVIKIMTKTRSSIEQEGREYKLSPLTLYGTFKSNKLFGKCVIVSNNCIYTCNCRLNYESSLSNNNNMSYSNPCLQIITKQHNNNRNLLPETLKLVFPYLEASAFSLEGCLQKLLAMAVPVQGMSEDGLCAKYHPVVINVHDDGNSNNKYSTRQDSDRIFYGFSMQYHTHSSTHHQQQQHQSLKRTQFGLIIESQEILSMGEHVNHRPHGLALVYNAQDNGFHYGGYRAGKMHGVGVRYWGEARWNRFVYGEWRQEREDRNKSKQSRTVRLGLSTDRKNGKDSGAVTVYEEGTQYPHKILAHCYRSTHLRSPCFDSGYAQIDMALPQIYAYLQQICTQLSSTQANSNTATTNMNMDMDLIDDRLVKYETQDETKKIMRQNRQRVYTEVPFSSVIAQQSTSNTKYNNNNFKSNNKVGSRFSNNYTSINNNNSSNYNSINNSINSNSNYRTINNNDNNDNSNNYNNSNNNNYSNSNSNIKDQQFRRNRVLTNYTYQSNKIYQQS